MSLLALPKTSSFTEKLQPDSAIPNKDAALANENNVIHTPRILKAGAFSYTLPQDRKEYKYLTSSPQALKDLGIDDAEVESETFRDIVSGKFYLEPKNFIDKGFPFPYSQAYAGWQFGQFAGQLGDGRVVTLFELPKSHSKNAANRAKYELQLKGAGLTPYSRFADGKAVLRSSIREYIISEHLNAIGIPTTRALSLTYLPKTLAQRYGAEKCAIVARFAEAWVRLGTFDLYRYRGDRAGILQLSNYVIDELFTVNDQQFPYFNELLTWRSDFFDSFKQSLGELTKFDKMYYEVVVRNATNTAKWQTYGFLNGVLNTDNTSVLGLSIDYGPFSIMDKFDPNYTPNSEDHESRYGYRNTPTAMWWNLTRFGENLAELIGAGPSLLDQISSNQQGISPEWEETIIKRATKIIEIGGEIYTYAFTKAYVEGFFKRLGLSPELVDKQEPNIQNKELIEPLLQTLQKLQCDFNKFFVLLQSSDFTSQDLDMLKISQSVLASTKNDVLDDEDLIKLLSEWLKSYQVYLVKSEELGTNRQQLASQHNPLFLPRNWILDEVIEFTQDSGAEDLSYLKKLEKMSFSPYDRSAWGDDLKELEQKWMVQGDVDDTQAMLQCSCSS